MGHHIARHSGRWRVRHSWRTLERSEATCIMGWVDQSSAEEEEWTNLAAFKLQSRRIGCNQCAPNNRTCPACPKRDRTEHLHATERSDRRGMGYTRCQEASVCIAQIRFERRDEGGHGRAALPDTEKRDNEGPGRDVPDRQRHVSMKALPTASMKAHRGSRMQHAPSQEFRAAEFEHWQS